MGISIQKAVLSKTVNLRLGMHCERVQLTVTKLKTWYDVLLGIPWLEAHDPAIGWKERVLHLRCGQKNVIIKGERVNSLKQASQRPSIQMVTLPRMLKDCM